jgi:hypothetical protein
MAVDDVGVSLAFAAPHARQSTRKAAPQEPFVESFTDFGEELAAGIIKSDCARPVNGCMGNQVKANRSRVIDCLDDVARLV